MAKGKSKLTTVKVDKELAQAIALIAKGKGLSVGALIRAAIEAQYEDEIKAVATLRKGADKYDEAGHED